MTEAEKRLRVIAQPSTKNFKQRVEDRKKLVIESTPMNKSDWIKEWLDQPIPWYKRFKWRLSYKLDSIYYKLTTERFRIKVHVYKSLFILRLFGYNPIIICDMIEDTFVFETDDESLRAYSKLELKKRLLCGWFYGKEDFEKEKDPKYCIIYWKRGEGFVFKRR